MPAPSTADEFITLVAKSELVPPRRLEEYVAKRRAEGPLPNDMIKLALSFVNDGILTKYQAEQLLAGRWRNFIIAGKYKLLEKLGRGGMALVFLCEHQVMKRLVALKILPSAHGEDRELLGRFHREARALSSLRHPNIVGAFDVDHANKVHFLVMEYIDGGDLDYIVHKSGAMPWERAANYIQQAARGLQHAHECGLVHRDVKPGNLLVDRAGTVKLLDLGLARIFHESTDDLTTGRDSKTLLGTVDYLAPEQALNSHDVDIRADIYGLGATFYFLLTAKGLFEDGTVAQKLSWHLHRPPVPIEAVRPDVPADLIRVIDRMLAKKPEERYQTPDEVVEALEPWTLEPVAPPKNEELPQISRAARGVGLPSSGYRTPSPTSRTPSPTSRTPSPASRTPLGIPEAAVEAPSTVAKSPPSEATKVDAVPPSIAPVPEPPAPPAVVPAPAPGRKRKTARIAAMVAGLLAVAAGVWVAVVGLGGIGFPAATPKPDARLIAAGPVNIPPEPEPAPVVDRSGVTISLASATGAPRPFPTLREALRAARPGDRALVRGASLAEAVEVSDVDGAPKDLTIEGVNTQAKGKPVVWHAPRDLSQGRALLDVSGLEGFRLKGFLFDGEGRVAELVRLSGRAAGSSLEDVQVQGATRAGVVLRGWAGDSSRPAVMRGMRFTTADESEAAILFEADPDRPAVASESIRIQSCRFVGPFQAALMVSAPVEGLDVEHCRFFRAGDGLRYRRAEARGPLRVRLANNTFVELQRGLHFETTPPAASSELVVTNNVFSQTPRLAMLDRVVVQPPHVAGRWIWTDEGKGKTTVPPGVRQFRKVFDVPEIPARATLDISCDETFAVWLNGAELARNPSPHYTQRVFSYDIAKKLKPGRNVLAVQGTNRLDRLDAKFGTTAGLLAQVTTQVDGREVVLVRTDETWKFSTQAPEGWTRPDFDDQSWAAARPWPEEGVTWPWLYAVWDSTVLPQLKPPLEPIKVTCSGNVRDYKSWEGYPTLDAERIALQPGALPTNPDDDAKFLRYAKSHPLAQAGPGGSRIGVGDGD